MKIRANTKFRAIASPSEGGYSLVELLVVLAIIAVMMAIVVPRFAFQQKGAGLKGASRELMSALRVARRQAIAERELRALALDIYSIPAEFVVMRWTGTTWAQEGESRRLPDNIAVVGIDVPGWTNLDITRTDDVDLDDIEDTSAVPSDTQVIFNPQVDSAGDPATTNGIVNPVYRLIKFQPTGTADSAMIYIWNTTEERRELPSPTAGQTTSNIHKLGVPPGLLINNASNQAIFFEVPTDDSPADAYYYTLVVNPITGGVIVYDYAWGTGGWDRKKDGE